MVKGWLVQGTFLIICGTCKAPALQLQEHAAAIVADDEAAGFQRSDPFVQAIAKGDAKHSAACNMSLTFDFGLCGFLCDMFNPTI